MPIEMDEKCLGYSKCIREFTKKMEEQRIKPDVPRKPILKKVKPIPAPRNIKNRESFAGTSNDIKALDIASEGTSSKNGMYPISTLLILI